MDVILAQGSSRVDVATRCAHAREKPSTRRWGQKVPSTAATCARRSLTLASASSEDGGRAEATTARGASSTQTLRGMFEAVRGAVLRPAEASGEASGEASASRRALSDVREAIGTFVTGVTESFDEVMDSGGDGERFRTNRTANAERRRRARTLTAERRKRRRDAKTREELAALRPSAEILELSEDAREAIGLDCDEMHLVPVGDASGWSAALLRYRADANVAPKRPVIVVPGCASNGMTFDVDPKVSLPRYLTARGHEVWIVETRGVGYARRWTRPREDYTSTAIVERDGEAREVEIPMMRSVGFGLWDFDTLLLEDLFAACEYIAEVGKRGDFVGVGHSMGGMLLASLAAIGPKEHEIGETSSWSMTRVCTLASCLECSEESDPESPASVYARFAALAGHLPKGLTANPSTTTVQLPIAPASVATAEAFQFVLGPPPPIDRTDAADPDPAKAFWRNSVSPVTCHPGATDSEFLRRLLLRGFNNVPLSLLLQMATLFTPGGMRSRDPSMGVDETSSVRAAAATAALPRGDSERVAYLAALQKANVPVCAVAGDVDPIFPPNQVKAFAAKANAEFHVFGDSAAPRDDPDAHFSHYDVICGRHAPDAVFPTVAAFLSR